MDTIPLIDYCALRQDTLAGGGPAVQALETACREIGFFALVNHQVDLRQMQHMRSALAEWFARPLAEKQQVVVEQYNYRGYIPLGMFTPNQDEGQADAYEGYKLHFETRPDDPICGACDLYGPNRWPQQADALRAATESYWQSMQVLEHKLLAGFACLLGLDADTLLNKFRQPLTNMTLLHYPPSTGTDGFGIHPHKDTDAVTLLYPDRVGGLQVRTREGEWIEASGPDDALIVNTGNMLETWSGGRILSTPHRVINRSGQERYSFPYFSVPRYDVLIEPLLEPLPGFRWKSISSGALSAEVWRTNWPDQRPVDAEMNLGSLSIAQPIAQQVTT